MFCNQHKIHGLLIISYRDKIKSCSKGVILLLQLLFIIEFKILEFEVKFIKTILIIVLSHRQRMNLFRESDMTLNYFYIYS